MRLLPRSHSMLAADGRHIHLSLKGTAHRGGRQAQVQTRGSSQPQLPAPCTLHMWGAALPPTTGQGCGGRVCARPSHVTGLRVTAVSVCGTRAPSAGFPARPSAGFHQAQAGGRVPGSGELFLVFNWAVWIPVCGHLKVIDSIKKSRRVLSLPKEGPLRVHER